MTMVVVVVVVVVVVALYNKRQFIQNDHTPCRSRNFIAHTPSGIAGQGAT
jgi:hypothetical protein